MNGILKCKDRLGDQNGKHKMKGNWKSDVEWRLSICNTCRIGGIDNIINNSLVYGSKNLAKIG